jgi:hypothetical protein
MYASLVAGFSVTLPVAALRVPSPVKVWDVLVFFRSTVAAGTPETLRKGFETKRDEEGVVAFFLAVTSVPPKRECRDVALPCVFDEDSLDFSDLS